MSRRVRVTWRHKGGRKPDDVVYVGRPSRWGNPFPVKTHGRDEAIRLYRDWLQSRPDLIDAARGELAGKDLACWCPPDEACHGDILLRVAAGGEA
ncbi:MAG: DUF4326 domain-containing protein [Nocardioidaceae bacterium]